MSNWDCIQGDKNGSKNLETYKSSLREFDSLSIYFKANTSVRIVEFYNCYAREKVVKIKLPSRTSSDIPLYERNNLGTTITRM